MPSMSSGLSIFYLVVSHAESLDSLLIILEFVLMPLRLVKKAGLVST